jgi:hypothetical protein
MVLSARRGCLHACFCSIIIPYSPSLLWPELLWLFYCRPCPADAAKALSWALVAGNFNCVELLIKTFPGLIDQTYWANTSALGLAFEHGKTEIVKLLLNNGAKMTSETNVRTNMLKQNDVRTKDETLQEVINFCAKYHERSLKQVCIHI